MKISKKNIQKLYENLGIKVVVLDAENLNDGNNLKNEIYRHFENLGVGEKFKNNSKKSEKKNEIENAFKDNY